MSILGNRVLRREDPALLTRGGTYVDDLDLPGAAFITYVRSTMAHARLATVDVAEARAMPGVLAVVTADDLGLDDLAPAMPMFNVDEAAAAGRETGSGSSASPSSPSSPSAASRAPMRPRPCSSTTTPSHPL